MTCHGLVLARVRVGLVHEENIRPHVVSERLQLVLIGVNVEIQFQPTRLRTRFTVFTQTSQTFAASLANLATARVVVVLTSEGRTLYRSKKGSSYLKRRCSQIRYSDSSFRQTPGNCQDTRRLLGEPVMLKSVCEVNNQQPERHFRRIDSTCISVTTVTSTME